MFPGIPPSSLPILNLCCGVQQGGLVSFTEVPISLQHLPGGCTERVCSINGPLPTTRIQNQINTSLSHVHEDPLLMAAASSEVVPSSEVLAQPQL